MIRAMVSLCAVSHGKPRASGDDPGKIYGDCGKVM